MNETEEILKEAKAFLNRMGLTDKLQGILESDKATRVMEDSFKKIRQTLMRLRDNAPESLKGAAGWMVKEYLKNEGTFRKLACDYFLLNQYYWLREVYTHVAEDDKIILLIMELCTEKGTEAFLNDLSEILDSMYDMTRNKFVKELYEGYVPDGMPREIFSIIGSILGDDKFVTIPFQSVVSMYEDQDDDGGDQPTGKKN